MEKGKYGIYLWFYAVIAFILAFLGQSLLGGLLLGFVIVVEKNDWLTKQVIQAFLLTLFNSVAQLILGWIKIGRIDFSDHGLPWMISNITNGIGAIVNGFIAFLGAIVTVAVLVFCIIGIVNVSKGKDANIPLFSKIANRAFGIVEKKIYTNYTQHNDQTPPNQQS
ncbi:hypothetical protein RBG61_10800 [Paludicola sp. MB14-C6]|uniref:hypothetical protein n=1 Tax=Paludihabitans sp. MB14-C6 TaxID=3070656 RepID=UPI0027DAF1C7|nr:hypothetical protein [Paludicola sp. MB14-C6]WMJ22471.1 hypothetical protein RBG61_10800 [Paludicola sp. MB14-C6]